jgi:hypothetical protein
VSDVLPIVARLRQLVILDEVRSDNPLGSDAADAIELLVNALEPYACKCPVGDKCRPRRVKDFCASDRARVVLDKVRAMR